MNTVEPIRDMNIVLDIADYYRINTKGRGYAAGTASAEPGFHLVGETGPEAVLFGGGERVLNAAETSHALEALDASDGRGNVESNSFVFSPNITFSGTSVTKEDVADVLEDAQENFKRMMEDYVFQRARIALNGA